MMLARILVGINLFWCASAFGQSPITPKAQSIQQNINSQDRREYLEDLIDRLALTDEDSFVERGQSYVRPESSARINDATQRLSAAGKASWAVLMQHLDDRRESMASRQESGPHTIGRKCYHILRSQIVSLPAGYPRSKLSPERSLDNMFQPTLSAWMLKRKDSSLEELRIEVLTRLISLEKDDHKQNPELRADALDRLERHLATLKRQLEWRTR